MVEYLGELKKAEAEGLEKPRIPEYIGLAIWKIAENLAKKGNFSGYTFIEEMKSDGIENCMQYLHNFNPEKSHNPFAYFTRIIWFAFLRRITKEKKQQYIKYKLSLQHTDTEGTGRKSFTDGNLYKHTTDYDKKMAEFAEKFEQDNNIKKPKKKGLDRFTKEDK